jgi:hypothetical protein
VRIADTLLRRGHLSEDTLVEAWYAGTHPAHLDTCDVCAERALEVSRWLEQTRELGIAEADAAFPAERLAAQQSQILRKLEQLDRPAKLLSFPRVTAEMSAPVDLAGHGHRVSSRWIAAAAAAGLILGVIGGRLSMWQPTPPAAGPVRSAAVQATVPGQRSAEAANAVESADLLLESDVSLPQIRELSAIDTLTRRATVVRASDRRR